MISYITGKLYCYVTLYLVHSKYNNVIVIIKSAVSSLFNVVFAAEAAIFSIL